MESAVAVSPVVEMQEIQTRLEQLAAVSSQLEAVDLIRETETCKALMSAIQARATAVMEALRHNEEALRDVPADRRGKGLGAEIGLARMESPTRGAQHLKHAGLLLQDLPHTYAALARGHIREEHAYAVAREVSWLSREDRQRVDRLLEGKFGSLGPRQLGGMVRFHAQRLDQAGALKRLAKAESQRCVTVRPAAEGMAYLTALLPLQQAVGACASLHRTANTLVSKGDTSNPADPTATPRTQQQIMADLFVERLTGQATAQAVPAEVHLVMSDGALFGADATPAWVTGHGPIPASMAKAWLAHPEAEVFLRRVFTEAKEHQLVRLESVARAFPAGIRRMVILRDDVCSTPYCGAAIQQIDHVRPVRNGGATTWTNASGLCAGCNKLKENIDWSHERGYDYLSVKTPTGHTYRMEVQPILPTDDSGQPPDKKLPVEKPPETRPPPGTVTPYRCRSTTPIITQRIAQLRAA